MATYRQIRESLGIHEGIVKSKKEARPGDIWKTDSGNWYGLRKDKDTGEEESQSMGPKVKTKLKYMLQVVILTKKMIVAKVKRSLKKKRNQHLHGLKRSKV